jgi:hypothetical protein
MPLSKVFGITINLIDKKQFLTIIKDRGGVAQVVRAYGSYP